MDFKKTKGDIDTPAVLMCCTVCINTNTSKDPVCDLEIQRD